MQLIPDCEDIARYILENYTNKVIEIGVGNSFGVALALKEELDIVVTDMHEQKYAGVRFCRDDVFAPDMGIYRNATLLYSIRPPVDLQVAMAKIAREVGADLLIRPFGHEKAELGRYFKKSELINYGKARFYLYRS